MKSLRYLAVPVFGLASLAGCKTSDVDRDTYWQFANEGRGRPAVTSIQASDLTLMDGDYHPSLTEEIDRAAAQLKYREPKKIPFKLETYSTVNHGEYNSQINILSEPFTATVGADEKTHYFFGMLDILLNEEEGSRLIALAHQITNKEGEDSTAFQAAFNPDSHWSIGGGFTDLPGEERDTSFVRVYFRKEEGKVRYAVGSMLTATDNSLDPGVFGLVGSNDVFSSGFGGDIGVFYDGEQMRYIGGLIFPALDEETGLRPAVDILHVDNTVGGDDGATFTLANMTLGYEGKFFQPANRFGRMLGPKGVFPQLYISPVDSSPRFDRSFSRIGNPQEIARLLTVQYTELNLPNGTTNRSLTGVAFPFQFLDGPNELQGVFIGGSYQDFGEMRYGVIGGIRTDVVGGSLSLSVDVNPEDLGDIQGSLSFTIFLK